MNQLYLECYSGISGDMFVASLLDLGASKEVLEEVLSSLPLTGFKTEITRVNKSGLDVCDFNVILDHDNHDHDMNYLYGEHTHHEHHHHHGGGYGGSRHRGVVGGVSAGEGQIPRQGAAVRHGRAVDDVQLDGDADSAVRHHFVAAHQQHLSGADSARVVVRHGFVPDEAVHGAAAGFADGVGARAGRQRMADFLENRHAERQTRLADAGHLPVPADVGQYRFAVPA